MEVKVKTEKSDEYSFVQTKNTVKIIDLCKELAEKKRWGAVIGQPGTGKSEIKKVLSGFFQSLPDKYIPISFECFSSSRMGVGGIMKEMIRTINPDERIPANGQTRFRLLRNVLIEAVQRRKRVVVLFDESQNMGHDLIREIKQLWEIEGLGYRNLFSIIFFLKSHSRFETIFDTNEIGKRILIERMELPGAAEILEIARAHGLKFADERAKRAMLDTAKTPLDVRHVAESMDLVRGFDGTLTAQGLNKGRCLALAAGLEAVGMSQRKFADYVSQKTGKAISQTEIHRILTGQDSKRGDEVREIGSDFLKEEAARKVM
jgi:type II secretory pathway predicted ATPase ExeA